MQKINKYWNRYIILEKIERLNHRQFMEKNIKKYDLIKKDIHLLLDRLNDITNKDKMDYTIKISKNKRKNILNKILNGGF